jgi:uncharacterized protein
MGTTWTISPVHDAGVRDVVPADRAVPRITSLLIKPASAVCNLDCTYCFYLDRDADPYKALPARRMTAEVIERLVDTYLSYSYPNSTFAFQGGEPTLAGLPFFENVTALQQRYSRGGQTVGNALQTNGVLLDRHWCEFLGSQGWLLGVSLDGTEEMNDQYRLTKAGKGTWQRVVQNVGLLQKHNVAFNVLCVLSQANVEHPKALYQFFRSLGVEHIQFIPLAEFDAQGQPLPFTISAAQYGRFLCELFDLWWPDRRSVCIRFFDNIAEAVAGRKPTTCTMHETCDSYAVVEYNGDVYPCDFFVEGSWKLGNIGIDSWTDIARRSRRESFASKKTLAHPACQVCDYRSMCHGGCPKFRHGPQARFDDLDYFCEAYKMIYARSVGPLREELRAIFGHQGLPSA